MAQPDCEVAGVGEATSIKKNLKAMPAGMKVHVYDLPPRQASQTHPLLRDAEAAVIRGERVAEVLMRLKAQGYAPDLIYAHPGWGEALFIKDVFPETKLIVYGEFFFDANGRDVGFDPEFPSRPDEALRLRARNMTHLSSMAAADVITTPTGWQKQCMPASLQDRVVQIHDGIDTHRVHPSAKAHISLARDSLTLTPQDEIITFVNRNLEPYRGFHIFMRALPKLLERRPNARVIMVGGDDVSYGRSLDGQTWRQYMLNEVGAQLDMSRVHFVGKVPYSTYLNMLQVSTAHVYLTYPFVLSWSMLEAMAAGCLVVGSRTAPVTEVIRDGENGLLVDFFSPEQIVEAVCRVCEHPDRMAALRQQARKDVQDRFDLRSVCLPQQIALIERLAGRQPGPIPMIEHASV